MKNDGVPSGTTKCTFKKMDKDGKLDRERLGITTQAFPRNPTDHVSTFYKENTELTDSKR